MSGLGAPQAPRPVYFRASTETTTCLLSVSQARSPHRKQALALMKPTPHRNNNWVWLWLWLWLWLTPHAPRHDHVKRQAKGKAGDKGSPRKCKLRRGE